LKTNALPVPDAYICDGCDSKPRYTANISKFSDSENAPKKP